MLQLLDFALEFRFVLKVIVTRPAAQDFAAFPILKDTAQVFAGNSSHGREVALPDLVLNDDAVRSDIPPEMIRQFEQRKGNATLQRQEAPRSDRHVGLAKALGEKRDQRFVKLGMPFRKGVKLSAGKSAQLRITYGHDRR